MKDVKKDIQRMKNLSTIPVIMQRLLETISDENSSYIDLSEIIERDQSLAKRVVTMANSSYFGHSGMINSLEQAILMIGFDLVKSIAISMSVFEAFVKNEAKQLSNFWAHCYEVGIISGLLCEKIPVTTSGVCFLSGLLHDIGKVIFYSLYKKEYIPIMFTEQTLGEEHALFGTDHAVGGAWFLESAMVPDEIVVPVRYHHDITGCEKHKGIALTVYLAESLSALFSPKKENDGVWDEDNEKLFYENGLKKEDLEQIETIIEQEAPSIVKFFEL